MNHDKILMIKLASFRNIIEESCEAALLRVYGIDNCAYMWHLHVQLMRLTYIIEFIQKI